MPVRCNGKQKNQLFAQKVWHNPNFEPKSVRMTLASLWSLIVLFLFLQSIYVKTEGSTINKDV
jgi:hypothetical protein